MTGGRDGSALTGAADPSDAVPLHGAVLKRLTRNERPFADLLRGPYAFVGGHCTKGAKIHHVEDRSKADQTLLNCRLKNHFRHRRQVCELFRNLAPLGLNSLIISSAKLCMIANQLDLRAAFFIFFALAAKPNTKYRLILLFSRLDGRETLFIAPLRRRAGCYSDVFRNCGNSVHRPTGDSVKK